MATETGPHTAPKLGAYAIDESTGHVGRVEAITSTAVQFGPIGGGPSWQAPRGRVRPATMGERQSAGVKVANARTFDPRESGGLRT
ncbi:hypothetical protein AB0I84_09455 [Streptomyces spectabilis]|uniref:hypothetical protein n=1 Tax=Streptomyces spectabilis TaxID=68270 RepID=UPI0034100C4B